MAIMIPPIYNTDRPVGQSEANQSDDVRLVQTLLTEFAQATPGWAPSTRLAVDGVFSSNMADWIRAFQSKMRAIGAPVVVDGKIHPMLMDNKFDFRSKFRSGVGSTLFALNVNLRLKAKAAHQSLGTRLGLNEPVLT
jgi:hypothetical protein